MRNFAAYLSNFSILLKLIFKALQLQITSPRPFDLVARQNNKEKKKYPKNNEAYSVQQENFTQAISGQKNAYV